MVCCHGDRDRWSDGGKQLIGTLLDRLPSDSGGGAPKVKSNQRSSCFQFSWQLCFRLSPQEKMFHDFTACGREINLSAGELSSVCHDSGGGRFELPPLKLQHRCDAHSQHVRDAAQILLPLDARRRATFGPRASGF